MLLKYINSKVQIHWYWAYHKYTMFIRWNNAPLLFRYSQTLVKVRERVWSHLTYWCELPLLNALGNRFFVNAYMNSFVHTLVNQHSLSTKSQLVSYSTGSGCMHQCLCDGSVSLNFDCTPAWWGTWSECRSATCYHCVWWRASLCLCVYKRHNPGVLCWQDNRCENNTHTIMQMHSKGPLERNESFFIRLAPKRIE